MDSVLIELIKQGDADGCLLRIQEGSDVNASDPQYFDWAPIHHAVMACHAGVLQVLLQEGADPFRKELNQNTALHLAAAFRSLDCVNVLCEHVCNDKQLILATNNCGQTALHCAVAAGSLEICSRLLQAGVNPENMDSEGRTALACAATPDFGASLSSLLEEAASSSGGPNYVTSLPSLLLPPNWRVALDATGVAVMFDTQTQTTFPTLPEAVIAQMRKAAPSAGTASPKGGPKPPPPASPKPKLKQRLSVRLAQGLPPPNSQKSPLK